MTRSRVVTSGLLLVAGLIVGAALLLRAERGREPVAGPVAGRPAAEALLPLMGAGTASDVQPLVHDVDTTSPQAEDVAAASAEPFGSVTVAVTWGEDGTPAADVGIIVMPWDSREVLFEGRTDAAGLWSVPRCPIGGLCAYLDRCEVGGNTIVRSGAASRIALTVPPGVDVDGVVVDERDRPVAYAGIWLSGMHRDTDAGVATRADGSGRFALRDVSEGRSIGARAAGFVPSPLRNVLFARDMRPLKLMLRTGGAAVRGSVADASGGPVAGALVIIGNEDQELLFPQPGRVGSEQRSMRLVTDDRGAFDLQGTPLGELPWVVSARGWSPATGSVSLEPDRIAELAVRLEPAAMIVGTVVNEAGLGVAGATITVGGHGIDQRSVASRADGSYALDDVPIRRTIQLAADSEEFCHATDGGTLLPGETRTWNPVLTEGLALPLLIVNEYGNARPGLSVRAQAMQGGDAWTGRGVADSNGRIRIEHCPAASLMLRVYPPDRDVPILTVPAVPAGQDELPITVPDSAWMTARIRGRVLDQQGLPPQHWRVSLTRPEWCDLPMTIDAATGAFEFDHLAPTSYVAVFRTEGNDAFNVPVDDLMPNEGRDLGTIVPPKQGRLRVRLHTPAGISSELVELRLIAEGSREIEPASHQGDEVLFPWIFPGLFDLQIGGAVPRERQPVLIEAGTDRVIDVDAHAGVPTRLRFRLPDEDSGPMLKLWVTDGAGAAVIEGEWNVASTRESGQDAVEVSEVLLPGHYAVSVSAGYRRILEEGLDIPQSPAPMQEREFLLSP